MTFRPSLTEDERQTLIDVMDFACGQLMDGSNMSSNPASKLAFRIAREKVTALRSKLFPLLYPVRKVEEVKAA